MALFAYSLWGPLLIGSVLRLLGLDRLSYWFDEIATLTFSRPPISTILSSGSDGIFHPPLYYAIMHYWIIPSDAAVWTRLFSALVGIGTIPVVYALGRRLFNRQVGVVAAWLLALSPWHIWYSQETRMYALVCLWGALSLLCGVSWVQAPHWHKGLGYVTVTVLGLYTNYTMVAIWPLAAVLLPLWLRGSWSTGKWLPWLGLQALVILCYGPQLSQLPSSLSALYNSDYLGASIGSVADNLPRILFALILVGLVAGVVGIGLRRLPALYRQQLIVGALLLLLGGSLLIMLSPSGTLLKRLLSIFIPLLCLGGAWAITQVHLTILRLPYWVAVSAVAVGLMFVLVPKEPWRELVAYLDRVSQPGDLVIVEPPHYTLAFAYYDRNNLSLQQVNPQGLTPDFAHQIAAARRVWLILSSESTLDPSRQVRSWFAARYHPALDWEYYRITVQRYDVGGP